MEISSSQQAHPFRTNGQVYTHTPTIAQYDAGNRSTLLSGNGNPSGIVSHGGEGTFDTGVPAQALHAVVLLECTPVTVLLQARIDVLAVFVRRMCKP